MKRLLTAASAVFFLSSAYAETKFLEYKFNEHVVVRISNVDCPIKDIKKNFPWGAVAIRADGQYLFGCFNHNKDEIVIQWAGGDTSRFPANYFLMNQ